MAKRTYTAGEYRDEVAALLPPLPVVELPLADCLGLVLAEDVVAGVSLPPFDNSAMDGYAVRAEDIASAPVTLPVADDIPAGRTDVQPLEPGTAHRIMTGAPLPPGADAVVQVELTDAGTETVHITSAVPAGKHLRRTGEDVVEGVTVLHAGTVIGPPQLGLAAAVGLGTLPVRRPPRVIVLSTGSELVAAGEPLPPGHIYESNSVLIAAAVREIGGNATVLRFVPDDVDKFRAVVAEHAPGADLLITSGGVSAGAYEVVKDALTGHGVEFVRVAMQPGGPQGFGTFLGLPVLTLPGNPVSAALSFELFVRPALLGALGHRVVDRPRAQARATVDMSSPGTKTQYRRARHDDGMVEVMPVGGPGSHLLSAFAASNCLIEIPVGIEQVKAGDKVDLILLD
ncbi:molybdopterin molybdochelatase [Actinokineospora alba]|uniref:Molybdopterin molybdenumtransferase n=1 Tax=Actinokineospora alba TaxID=504798 RepID=A0A1H0SEW7_9PSEU|nr:gephyrin-like molybdotransferase Glp [Actinokineospora alba]TDP66631.1 molybdopterin molybdotransferase [Actinokineospora alba]SDI53470.1 molybdopterin molybdotransferase [Actinokineospora alba]SDP39758.1 molybdopterin molybdochelatase [Actinokineospora alba]